MDVEIVVFPDTKVAVIEYYGPPALEHDKLIPRNRCALARDIGSRHDNKAVVYLCARWLPQSGEEPGEFPVFLHYANVGPSVREEEMITDVYLPLRPSSSW